MSKENNSTSKENKKPVIIEKIGCIYDLLPREFDGKTAKLIRVSRCSDITFKLVVEYDE